ncbi:MAG: ABC transporter ATP-binding protein [Clostridiales bacterium]|nr:ABC transporter ATP-binding protein [Clostridiales bacterium]
MERELICCNGLTKSYAGRRVLDGVSLRLGQNEFVSVLGPGKCGKTTLIKLLSGLERPDAGEVFMDGAAVSSPSPKRGVVYQNTLLFNWLTVLGNVRYPLRKLGRQESLSRAMKYIELMGLKGFEKAYPRQLSGGMKQRCGIARIYAMKPRVIFMDEPFSQLDAQTRYLMQLELEKIFLGEGQSVLFVSNNIEEAVYLSDRIVVLSPSPSRVVKEFRLDLPRPRNYLSPEFVRIRAEIERCLSEVCDG